MTKTQFNRGAGGHAIPEIERFLEKVGPPDENYCWPWLGAVSSAGYGQFSCEPRRPNGRLTQVGAHRYSYELLVGPILEPQLDHLCRNPRCVNPAHLEPVSARENTLRGVGPSAKNAVATHCKRGHEFTPENTWLDEKRNTRHCRICSRARFRAWYERSGKFRPDPRRSHAKKESAQADH